MTGAWAVIAARGGAQAKSRLAGSLAPRDRAELAACMLEDMLRALADCRRLEGVLVTTPTPGLAAIAHRFGAELLSDSGSNLNAAFASAEAALAAAHPQAARVLLPGDLPLLHPRDIDQLVAALEVWPSVVVATPDGGTGAWARRAGTVAAPMFGAHSARRHLAQTAGAHGAPTNDYPSLRRDIDMPSDLVGLAAAQGASGRFVRAHFGDLVPCL